MPHNLQSYVATAAQEGKRHLSAASADAGESLQIYLNRSFEFVPCDTRSMCLN